MLNTGDQHHLVDEMVEFQKKTIKNSLNTFDLVQKRTGKMMELCLDQFFWFSGKWNEAIKNSSRTYRNNCERIFQAMGSRLEKFGQCGSMKDIAQEQAPNTCFFRMI